MRNAANDILDWIILLVWVIAVSVIVIAANNPDFSDYITELKHGAYDFLMRIFNMNNINELCEKYFWLIDEARNDPNETRVTIKGILAKFAGEVVEPEVKPEVKQTVRTQYVKCEFKFAWQAVKAFECGEDLYTVVDGTSDMDADTRWVYYRLDNNLHAISLYEDLYRKVETEITWQEIFEENTGFKYEKASDSFYFGGHVDDKFVIEFSHLVASLTDNPKG